MKKKYERLDPWWLVGFIDGEGSFSITVTLDNTRGAGYKVICEFKISQNYKSATVLHKIKDFFGCGEVNFENSKTGMYKYRVYKLKDLELIVIPFLKENKLQTSLYLDFIAFALWFSPIGLT